MGPRPTPSWMAFWRARREVAGCRQRAEELNGFFNTLFGLRRGTWGEVDRCLCGETAPSWSDRTCRSPFYDAQGSKTHHVTAQASLLGDADDVGHVLICYGRLFGKGRPTPCLDDDALSLELAAYVVPFK